MTSSGYPPRSPSQVQAQQEARRLFKLQIAHVYQLGGDERFLPRGRTPGAVRAAVAKDFPGQVAALDELLALPELAEAQDEAVSGSETIGIVDPRTSQLYATWVVLLDRDGREVQWTEFVVPGAELSLFEAARQRV